MTKLDALAAEIRQCFDSADQADHFRIVAGRKLIEARRRVEAGEAGATTWSAWVAEHVQRSERDVRKVMSLARAPDPAAALKKERASARAGMARKRSQGPRANVSPPPDAAADDAALVRYAIEQCDALRLTLVAIKDHHKRARALALVDLKLADVRQDIEQRRWRGELKRRRAA